MTTASVAIPSNTIDVDRADRLSRFRQVRQLTQRLCEPLATEDFVVQSMPDVSPTKWHLAHTSWFFETFLLARHQPGYPLFDPHFAYLFNSYYITVGDRHCRQNRGLLSRPTVADVWRYREHVDAHMERFLNGMSTDAFRELMAVIDLGLHHEQQHQELTLTDIKHVFSVNPLRPAYRPELAPTRATATSPMRWVGFDAGVREIGFEGSGFSFDNESPRHRIFLEPFELASRLVTNREYRAFINDGGYRRPELWLSAGWSMVEQEQWQAPLYWLDQDGQWTHYTLSGVRAVDDAEPVCHVSYFEADAFARWAGARLATEGEWESAFSTLPIEGNFVEAERYHPVAATGGTSMEQMYGDVWEWTGSAYLGYPGYRPVTGALGEYNGKFMCNQFVLRGGSCATSRSHIRPTYRNFFAPDARWQFSGIRLARSV